MDLLVPEEQIKEIILVLVAVLSNEGSGEPVHMCRATCQSLRCSYTQSSMEVDDKSLE